MAAAAPVRPGRRFYRLGLTLLLLGVAASLGGWRLRSVGPAGPAATPVAVQASAAGPDLPAIAAAGPAPPSMAAEPVATVRPAAPAASAAPGDVVEVCNFGPVKRADLDRVDGEEPPAWLQAFDRQSQQALADLVKRMQGGTVRQQVAGAILAGDTQTAAQRAVDTADVLAYRLALHACRQDASYRRAYAVDRSQPRPAASAASGLERPELQAPGPLPQACAALSVERLEMLAAGDAWPALLRLGDAQEQRDEPGVAQALYRLSLGGRVVAGERLLSAVVAELVGPSPSPGEAMALVSALGIDASQTLDTSWFSVVKACRGDALRDANRRQLCEQVAQASTGQARDAVDGFAMHRLREQLGLPPDRKIPSREAINQGLQALSAVSLQWLSEPTCASFSQMGTWVVQVSRGGELAWMRSRARQPGAASAPR